MVMTECGNEHWIWKAGWPQPGYEENGNEGVELKGGHDEILAVVEGSVEQECCRAAVEMFKFRKKKKKKRKRKTVVMAECGGGGGDDMVEPN